MSISTGPVIPLSCIISINNHSIYCSRIYINDDWNQDQIPNWLYNKIENSEDEIIEIVNKSWSNMAVTLQNTSQSQERISCAVPEQLFDAGKRLLPEFSKTKFGGQLRPTITVARRSFRPIPGNRANGVVKACCSCSFLYMKTYLGHVAWTYNDISFKGNISHLNELYVSRLIGLYIV